MGGGKSSSVTIGYRYYFGIHMGLGRGPVDQLVAIRVGDRIAWPLGWDEVTGHIEQTDPVTGLPLPPIPVYTHHPPPDPIVGNQSFKIRAGDLFGGDNGEGGIEGTCWVMMGGPDQTPVQPLVDMLEGAIVPGFRGVVTLFYDGLVCSLNPYPKQWKMRVRRWSKGWDNDDCWYPEKALIPMRSIHVLPSDPFDVYAMNPAHMLLECLTNRDWGRGLPRSMLNEESFVSAANTLCDEGFGLCLRWARQDTLQSFVGQILDHIGAALYVDRGSGLMTLRLIRDDYQIEDLPLFTKNSGLLDIEEDDASARDKALNEVVVKYHDPVDDEDRQVRVQNIANLQSDGQVFSDTRDYPGCPNAELALRLAQRDLRAESYGLRRFKVKLDRRAFKLAPAAAFRVSDPSRGIDNMVLRSGQIVDADITDGSLTISAIQDVFGFPMTSYIDPQPGGWQPPSSDPVPSQNRRYMTVPYRDLARVMSAPDLDYLDDAIDFMGVMASKPTSTALNYLVRASHDGGTSYADHGSGDFTPTATLKTGIGHYTKNITVNNPVDLDLVVVGEIALIGEELVAIESIDIENNKLRIKRGVADTIPAKHLAGDRIWFYEQYNGNDETEYTDGEDVVYKLLTRTSSATLPEANAAPDNATVAQRHALPYPPGNFRLNGQRFGEAVLAEGDLVMSWAHRDRLIEQDQLIAHEEGDIGPEPGTTYTVRIVDPSDDTVKRTQAGITANTWTYTAADILADWGTPTGEPTNMIVELESVRAGLVSWQQYRVTIQHYDVFPAGWGFNWGNNFGG